MAEPDDVAIVLKIVAAIASIFASMIKAVLALRKKDED